MHLTEKQYREYLDGELPPPEQQQADRHLAGCAACRGQAQMHEQAAERLALRLDALAPTQAESRHHARTARIRLDARLSQSKEIPMFQKIFSRKYRPALTAATFLLIFAVAFAFPSVRAAAVDFLGLFRVQKIEVFEFNPASLPQNLDSHFQDIEQVLADQSEVVSFGDPQHVDSAAEASELAGFAVRLPGALDGAPELMFRPGTQANFTVDRDWWQALLGEMGQDAQLPKALDGAEISIAVPGSVLAAYGECALEQGGEGAAACTLFHVMPSPSVTAPPELDMAQMGEVFLQVFGMSPAEAQAFSERVDWTTTLVMPVPEGADYRTLTVDGVEGVMFITSDYRDKGHGYDTQQYYSVIWVKDGLVYGLSGQGDYGDAVRIANSLK